MRYACFAFLGLLTSGALAQSEPSTNSAAQKEIERLNAQTARDTATTNALQASTAKLQAQIGALGLKSPEGKTTLLQDGAVMETWMLSAAATDAAGKQIAELVRGAVPAAQDPKSRRVLLLEGDEDIFLDAASGIKDQLDLSDRQLQEASAFCSGTSDRNSSVRVAPLAALGAFSGLLKSDVEIGGLDAKVPDRMLTAAAGKYLTDEQGVADDKKLTVVIPADAIVTKGGVGGDVAAKWKSFLDREQTARNCAHRLEGSDPPPALKPKVEALSAAIASATELENRLLKSDDKGRTPLGQAIRMEAVQGPSRAPVYVLRVSVEKGGGSFIKRSNIWTMLGAPAIGISGGLVSSYRLSDPATGSLLTSGTIVCRTALTNLRAVQDNRFKPTGKTADCRPLFQ